jgi:predicted metal-dependent hydrolase
MYQLLAHGIEQFNKGEFFECHDTLEELWNELSGNEKLFVQGLIQASVGCYHALNGNFRGADSQFGKSLAKLTQFLPSMLGVEITGLVEGIRACKAITERNLLGQEQEFSEEIIPKIPEISE